MEAKNKEVSSIEVYYFIPSEIIEVKEFPTNIKFKDIIQYFKTSIQKSCPNLDLKQNYCYKKNKINKSTNILDLLDNTSKLENRKIKIYLELIDNLKITYLLKPKNNPFGLTVFSVNSKTISSNDFDSKIIRSYKLDKYNPEFSAYCNSYNSIFISGGIEKNGDPITDFWIINHNLKDDIRSYKIKQLKMPYAKKEHSMLYNKEDDTIIIVGGNDKKCFTYSIKKNIFTDLPETNDLSIKPALIIKNNNLYVLDSFERKKRFFEKLKLEKMDKFEKITPKNYFLHSNKFFGVCESNSNNSFIICGGEKTGPNTIIFQINKNVLLKSKGKDQICKLDDKTFYKINNTYYINIPDSKDPKEKDIKSIMALDIRTNDIFKIMFDNKGKTTFKFDSNEENDISIDPKILSIKPSQSLDLDNSKDIDNEKPNNIEDNRKIISQSYNENINNFNINSDEIKLRANKKKINLGKIKASDDINNSDYNKPQIDQSLESIEIKVEQEAKDKDLDDKIIYKSKQSPRIFIPGPSLNEQLTNISVHQEKEKNNENKDIQDERKENNNQELEDKNEIKNTSKDNNQKEYKNEIENKEEKPFENKNKEKEQNEIENINNKSIGSKNIDKINTNIKWNTVENKGEEKETQKNSLKTEKNKTIPINLKLNQSNIILKNNNLKIGNSKNTISSYKSSRNYSKSVYLFDDSSINNAYNNYSFYEMVPDLKNIKNRLNKSTNLSLRIKKPFSKSRKIIKREINGLNYSVVCEKIIDKDNLPLYEALSLNENYSLENDFGNHKLYISQYLSPDSKDFIDFDSEKKTQLLEPKYKVNTEQYKKTTKLKPTKNVILNYKFKNIKERNKKKRLQDYILNSPINYSGEKTKFYNIPKSNSKEKKDEDKKNNIKIINNINERIVEPSKNLFLVDNQNLSQRKKSTSKDEIEPTKLRSSQKKSDVNKNLDEKIVINSSKDDYLNNKEPITKEDNIEKKNEVKKVTNKEESLVDNIEIIKVEENSPKENNLEDYKFKSNHLNEEQKELKNVLDLNKKEDEIINNKNINNFEIEKQFENESNKDNEKNKESLKKLEEDKENSNIENQSMENEVKIENEKRNEPEEENNKELDKLENKQIIENQEKNIEKREKEENVKNEEKEEKENDQKEEIVEKKEKEEKEKEVEENEEKEKILK